MRVLLRKCCAITGAVNVLSGLLGAAYFSTLVNEFQDAPGDSEEVKIENAATRRNCSVYAFFLAVDVALGVLLLAGVCCESARLLLVWLLGHVFMEFLAISIFVAFVMRDGRHFPIMLSVSASLGVGYFFLVWLYRRELLKDSLREVGMSYGSLELANDINL